MADPVRPLSEISDFVEGLPHFPVNPEGVAGIYLPQIGDDYNQRIATAQELLRGLMEAKERAEGMAREPIALPATPPLPKEDAVAPAAEAGNDDIQTIHTGSVYRSVIPVKESTAARMRRHKNMFSALPKYDGAADVSKLHEFTELHTKYLVATGTQTNEEVREHLPFYLTKLAGQWFRRLEQQGELSFLTYFDIFAKMKAEIRTEPEG